MRVLTAEDDELMLKTVEFRLKKDGHEVILVTIRISVCLFENSEMVEF